MKPLFFPLTVATSVAAVFSVTAASPRVYSVVERGPHHSVAVALDDRPGAPLHRIHELNTGKHYLQDGEWRESVPVWTETDQGFIADRVQQRVQLQRDIYGQEAVTISAPDGTVIRSSPAAISVFCRRTGAHQILGVITNCQGILLSSNQVVYPDAFYGVCADLTYTISQDAIEQDVTITGALQLPDGFDPETALLQIWSETYRTEPPERLRQPVRSEPTEARFAMPHVFDETLYFGSDLIIGSGTAYTTPSLFETNGLSSPVSKEYRTIDHRSWLVESLEYSQLASALLTLPECITPGGGGAMLNTTRTKGYAALPNVPARTLVQASPTPTTTRLAQAAIRRPGVTIDYRVTLSGGAV